MPANFKLPTWADLWMPMAVAHKGERTSREYHPFVVIGRLKPDVTLPQAQAEMATLAQRIEQEYPTWAKGWGTTRDTTSHRSCRPFQSGSACLAGSGWPCATDRLCQRGQSDALQDGGSEPRK